MNTFCSALFNSIRKDNDFRIRPCCVFNPEVDHYTVEDYINSEYIGYLKLKMQQGTAIEECNTCWQREKHGLTSHRHLYNQYMLGAKIVPDAIIAKAQSVITHADVKIGNRCNFACAMCHPGDSSLIHNRFAANPDNEFVQDYTRAYPHYMDVKTNTRFRNESLDYLRYVAADPNIRTIKILGGEPFVEREFIDTFAHLPEERKRKLSLYITTNGSFDLVEQCDVLGAFKNIFFTVSLEGVGAVQEYIRKRSSWTQIERNILRFRDAGLANRHLSIHHTLQALSLPGLGALIDWLVQHDLQCTYHLLTRPEYLSVELLDTDYRQELLEFDLQNTNQFWGDDIAMSGDIQGYALSKPYRAELASRFLRYIDFYEQDHTLTLEQCAPGLRERISTV